MTFYFEFRLRAFVLRFWTYDVYRDLFLRFEASTGISGKLNTWRGLCWTSTGFSTKQFKQV